jgi:hypothetical protein
VRDPELTHRAHVAAAGLERAWLQWRVVHGTAGDPMPTVSSYTGYSFEEPWGEPRVVFGLAAQDAERLTALLSGHDCVHVAGGQAGTGADLPGNGQIEQVAGQRGAPLPVPQQTASDAAEPVTTDDAARPAGPAASEPDVQADRLPSPDRTPSGYRPPSEQDASEPAAATPAAGKQAAPAATPAAGKQPAPPAAPAAGKQAAPGQTAAGHKATARRERKTAGRQASGTGATEPEQRRRPVPDHEPAAGPAAGGGAEQPVAHADRSPGPLASAASMARSEAEARIKAAMRSSEQAARQDGSAETEPPGVPAREASRGGGGHRLAPPRPAPREPGIGPPGAVVAAPASPAA